MTGKWQILRLLGKYRDRKGKDFRLGQFHDELIRNEGEEKNAPGTDYLFQI